MSALAARLREERGWAMVTSLLVLGILVSLALPLMSLVDTQQRQSGAERTSESSFNLAEAAFDAGAFVLARDWPGAAARAYPSACGPVTTDIRCPSADVLAQTYSGGDYKNRGWSIQIRDDADGGQYYDPAVAAAQPSWDANGNAKVWVRADGHAQGRDRTVVALVRRQDQLEPFPRNAVTAGWFGTPNGGLKVLVDTKGAAAQPAPVAVRCTTPAPSACLNVQPDRQISPDTSYTGYEGDSAIDGDALKRLKDRAIALDSYYRAACPQSPAGELVYVENASCGYAGGGTANTPATPGMFIVANGTVSFSGSLEFYGLVYAANLQRSAGAVVSVQGNSHIHGAIAVDGNGGITVGSSGRNLVYDANVFPLVKSFGGAAPVQGTWREMPPS